jgi:alanine racemase
LHALDVSQAVLSEEYAEALSSQAESAGVTVRAHVKFDTGMGRIGLFYQSPERDTAAISEAERICRLKGLKAEGIFTHFAVADGAEEGKDFTLAQYAAFSNAIEQLTSRGIHFEYRHCCNSAGIIDYPEMHMNLVRPGIILYGLAPSGKLKGRLNLKPAMELKSVLSHIKHVEAQTSVSNGRTDITDGCVDIATVPVGYADGYQRNLSGRACMQVCGKRAPIVGRVCMDHLMLDISGIPEASIGTTVTVFSREDVPGPSADELAELSGTINYEITCMVSKRVPRIYYKDGKMVGQLNLICP